MTGFGGFFVLPDGRAEYFGGSWSSYGVDTSGMHISQLEMLAVAIAAHQWGEYLAGRRIVVRVDNESSVYTINSGRCRDGGMMVAMRQLFFAACKHSFALRSRWISTEDNVLADAASRWDAEPRYRQVFFDFARTELGLSAEELTRVEPRMDVADALRRVHRSVLAAAREEERR